MVPTRSNSTKSMLIPPQFWHNILENAQKTHQFLKNCLHNLRSRRKVICVQITTFNVQRQNWGVKLLSWKKFEVFGFAWVGYDNWCREDEFLCSNSDLQNPSKMGQTFVHPFKLISKFRSPSTEQVVLVLKSHRLRFRILLLCVRQKWLLLRQNWRRVSVSFCIIKLKYTINHNFRREFV